MGVCIGIAPPSRHVASMTTVGIDAGPVPILGGRFWQQPGSQAELTRRSTVTSGTLRGTAQCLCSWTVLELAALMELGPVAGVDLAVRRGNVDRVTSE